MKENLKESNFFSEEILFFNEEITDQQEALQEVGGVLLKKGVVKPNFIPAILQREINYPTGLQLKDNIGVAIPHTDANKVIKDQIGFMSLKDPVTFRQMGSDTEKVKVKLIFVLCLKNAHEQLKMLQKLMEMFNDNKIITSLVACKNKNDFLNTMSNVLF